MNIPSKLSQGDSFSWVDHETTDNLGNPIDSTWTLKYEFRGPGQLTLTAVTDPNGWKTTITTTQSAGLVPGTYYWQAYASKASSRVTLGRGSIEISKDLSLVSTPMDGRSQTRKDLEAVQEAIRSIATGGVQEYTIGNRTFKKVSIPELRELESQLKYQLNREERSDKIKNGLGDPFTLKVRF